MFFAKNIIIYPQNNGNKNNAKDVKRGSDIMTTHANGAHA